MIQGDHVSGTGDEATGDRVWPIDQGFGKHAHAATRLWILAKIQGSSFGTPEIVEGVEADRIVIQRVLHYDLDVKRHVESRD